MSGKHLKLVSGRLDVLLPEHLSDFQAPGEIVHCYALDYSHTMRNKSSALASWTPEQIALGRRWVETWKLAGDELERIHRKELRELDTYRAIELLCGPADYTRPPRAPKSTSGLVEQQRLFMKARRD